MPDAEYKDTKVIMIMGISKSARASTLKLVERGHTVVLVANPENQAYLDELGSTITEMGGQSLALGIDCSSLLEVQAMFEATTNQYKNVNTFMHFSKGFGKINPEVLEFLQDKVNPVTGTTTCTMTDKWISKQSLDEMGQSVIPEEVRFPDFVTQRILGIREFESRETYHLVDKEADARRDASKAAESKAAEAKEPPATVHVATPLKKGAPPPPATPSTPLASRPIPATGTVLKKAPPPPATPSGDSSKPNFCKSCGKNGNSGVWCNFCGQKR
jgi:hypothetical protein